MLFCSNSELNTEYLFNFYTEYFSLTIYIPNLYEEISTIRLHHDSMRADC